MTSVALFNNKGGVGKTTLAYHLAHMLQRQGRNVLAVDLDPQANLTAAFLDDEVLAQIWGETNGTGSPVVSGASAPARTVAGAVGPIMGGMGDILPCDPIPIVEGLWLLAGDLTLSAFEDRLSEAWPKCFTGDDLAALRTTTAFHRIIQLACERLDAEIVLIDVGPNLGAINRAALLAADAVLIPLAADLFSVHGLRNLGPTLRKWRRIWRDKVLPDLPPGIDAPPGHMTPLGYVAMQPVMRLDRPVQAYQRWLDLMPEVFVSDVVGELPAGNTQPYEIATLRNYQSLMPLAQHARKPMFALRTGDGAIGSTLTLVNRCYRDFQMLAEALLDRIATLRR